LELIVSHLQKRVCIELHTREKLGSEHAEEMQTGAGVDLHHRLARSWAKHNQGFDGPAPVTEVSVNLKIAVQRVGGNLLMRTNCSQGFSSTGLGAQTIYHQIMGLRRSGRNQTQFAGLSQTQPSKRESYGISTNSAKKVVRAALAGCGCGRCHDDDHRLQLGGWMLGGTVEMVAKERADSAVVAALAPICVDKFRRAPNATENLSALNKFRFDWDRDLFLEKGGWATMPGATSPDPAVARICAETLRS
jgi:hypothetical protein